MNNHYFSICIWDVITHPRQYIKCGLTKDVSVKTLQNPALLQENDQSFPQVRKYQEIFKIFEKSGKVI